MASQQNSQVGDKHPDSTAELVRALKNLRQANPKACRPTVHLYPSSIYATEDEGKGEGTSQAPHRERRITSWKMTEHMYRSVNNQFPTLARGLFLEEVESGDDVPSDALACEGTWSEGQNRERIVARGYDKFFNIGEVAWTEVSRVIIDEVDEVANIQWQAMKRHTAPPYRLTLKSNGCLILISALDPQHLLVASKHSLGTTTEGQVGTERKVTVESVVDGISDMKVSTKKPTTGKETQDKANAAQNQEDRAEQKEAQAHAEVGRRWVRRTLQKTGKTEADLAKRLWESNSTAVLEVSATFTQELH